MTAYLIKSACCSILFLLLYRCILEKEKMHFFNRVFLLAAIVLSIVIPLITIPVAQESLQVIDESIPYILNPVTEPAADAIENIVTASGDTGSTLPVLWIVYGIITAVLLTRFAFNLYTIFRIRRVNGTYRYNDLRLVVTDKNTSSYTFFDTVFINRIDFENKEILQHEQAHVRQKHSLDILFIELVRIIFWFNPIYIFYKRSIQLNHEFLADEAVVQYCADIPAYQHLLLDRMSMTGPSSLSSRFNYSITKKRLQMMTRKTNHTKVLVMQLSALLLLISCFAIFGTKKAMSRSMTADLVIEQDTTEKSKQPVSKGAPYVLPFSRSIPATQEGITEKEMAEYFEIQRKYIDPAKASHESGVIISSLKGNKTDQTRLKELFLRMNHEQRQHVSVFFMTRPQPRRKEPPTQQQFEKWKNPNLYGVWIDEKKVSNETLNNYTASDFSLYDASKLYGAAKKNVKYQVQVDLMTNSFYEKYHTTSLKEDPYIFVVYWRDKKLQDKGREKVEDIIQKNQPQ